MITLFLNWRRSRRLSRIAQAQEHRRSVIMRQIADRREKHREFRPLYGELKASTHAALAAECELERLFPSRLMDGGEVL